ncbi:19850_t:CDS:2, partial [Gigaspora rosea]
EFQLNESNASDISENLENLHNSDAESNSNSPNQSTSRNTGVTITNSLGKKIRKRRVSHTKKSKPKESWVWDYFRRNKIEKKILLPLSKQDKIASRVLAWIVDDLQPFNAITNNCFQNMILECEPRFEFLCHDKLKEKLMQSVLFAERQLKDLMQTTMDSFSFTIDLWSQ